MRTTLLLISILFISLPVCLIAQEAEWTPINEGLDDLNVYTIAVDPDDPDVLYAGSDDGFCMSDDRGENWECTLEGLRVRSIWVSPDDGRILITRGDGSRSDGVWESNNGGGNFEVLHWFMYPSAIAVSPEDEDVMFIGSLQNGIVYTSNGGGNWSEANDGIQGEIHHLNIAVVDDDTYIFACTNRGLYRAVLADEIEWDEVGPHGLPAYQTTFSLDEETGIFVGTADESESDGLYYAGNLTEADEDSWDVLRWSSYVRAVETIPNLVVMGSTESGVARSADGGENWTVMNEELDDFDLSDLLLVDYEDELICYLTNLGDGIFYYSIPQEGPPSAFALMVPEDNSILNRREVTFRWEESNDPDGDVTYTWWLDNDDESVSVEEIEETSLVVDLGDYGLEVDDFCTWWVLAIEDQDTVESHERFSFVVREGSPSAFNLLQPDNGVTTDSSIVIFSWEESEDPDGEVLYDWWLHSDNGDVALDSLNETSLEIDFDQINMPIERGDTLTWWVLAHEAGDTVECNEPFSFVYGPLNLPPTTFNLLFPEPDSMILHNDTIMFHWEESIDPDSGSSVRYTLRLDEIDWFNLRDTVDTWFFPADTNFMEMRFDSLDAPWGCPLLPFDWLVLAISGEDTTVSNDSYRLEVAGPGSCDPDELIADNFRLLNVYPNPFNSSTTITYSLPVAAPISLQLYDLNGRSVWALVEGRKEAGVQRSILNADNLPSGLYFVRLEAAGRVQTRRVMLIR